MSRSVEIALAAGTLPAVAGGLGVLALGAGGIAYGVYALLKRLHEDYQEGLQEFHHQSSLEAQVRQHLTDRQRDKTNEVLELIAQTRVTSSTDINTEFLRHRVEQLRERHTRADDEFTRQCQTLLAEIAQAPESFNTHLEAYRRLADAATEQPEAARGSLAGEIAALREEILSPLLDAPDLTHTREQLLAQLDALQAVSVRQRTVARQGLSVLRQRVYREIQTQAERRRGQAKAAEERRYLVSGILAKLQAVLRVPDMPVFTDRAQALSAQLNETLAQDDGALSEIQQLAVQAGELFVACEQSLSAQVVSAYIQDEVSDVMASLGYQVTRISGEDDEQRLVAAMDDAHGVEFRVSGGNITSEMVALTPDAAAADSEAEEKACHIVDQFLAIFKEHHQGTRERFRTSLLPKEQLRVVEIEPAETAPPAAARKEMRIDES